MSLLMDIHSLEGEVSAQEVAAAHLKDLAVQVVFGVNYRAYWVDEKAGKIFCLVNAPMRKQPTPAIHRQAHGLVADEIYLVSGHP